jgi:hypothetical protein
MGHQMHDVAVKASRHLVEIKGATHYFEGQPDLLDLALDELVAWVERAGGSR